MIAIFVPISKSVVGAPKLKHAHQLTQMELNALPTGKFFKTFKI
jgi:hypothetical protein